MPGRQHGEAARFPRIALDARAAEGDFPEVGVPGLGGEEAADLITREDGERSIRVVAARGARGTARAPVRLADVEPEIELVHPRRRARLLVGALRVRRREDARR